MQESSLALTNQLKPQHYDLAIGINPRENEFDGVLTIFLDTGTQTQFETFKLHSRDIVVDSAALSTTSGERDLKISYDKANEHVILEQCGDYHLSKESCYIKLKYKAKLNVVKTHRDKTAGVFMTSYGNGNVIVATHCQPFSARQIFPCIDEVACKTTFQLHIKTQSKYKVLSNTGPESVDTLSGDLKEVNFMKTPLMNTAIFGFVVGDLDYIKSEAVSPINQKTIAVSVYAPDQITDATFTLDTIQKYIPILEKYFNHEYPIDKIDFVLLPFLSDMAMENFGLVTIMMNHLLLPPYALADKAVTKQAQQLIVHELVHQWMGNFISYDGWEHLWFNESFATWLACHLLETNGDLDDYWDSEEYIQQMKSTMQYDFVLANPSIVEAAQKARARIQQTSDAFDAHSYTKGITILRNLQLSIGDDKLQKSLQRIFQDSKRFHSRSIKPMDIWVEAGKILKSENVPNYMFSWTRVPGIPILSVQYGDHTTKLVQHRFLPTKYNKENTSSIEDVPYHIPLYNRLSDGKLEDKNTLMTDRSLQINSKVVAANHKGQGYYIVSYESAECYTEISKQLQKGTYIGNDLFRIFDDLLEIVGDANYQKDAHLCGAFELLQTLASQDVDLDANGYWKGLSRGLEVLQLIEQAVKSNKQFNYMGKIVLPLMSKIDWDDLNKLQYYSQSQLEVVSQLLFLTKVRTETLTVCQSYFKTILQGPSSPGVPIPIVGSVMAVVSQHFETVKQWKKLFDLVKSSKGIVSHITMLNDHQYDTAIFLQNQALQNLSFSTQQEIVDKVLNFVTTNIDSTGIESALFGLAYNKNKQIENPTSGHHTVRDYVWEWFNQNYDQWARRSRNAEQLQRTLQSITTTVFAMFGDSQGIPTKFIEQKTTKDTADAANRAWNEAQMLDQRKKTIKQGTKSKNAGK